MPDRKGGDDEGDQAMADDIDAGGLRRRLVFARSAQLQRRARLLIGESDDDGGQRPAERGPKIDIGRQAHERILPAGDRGPVAEHDIDDDQHREGRDARGNAGKRINGQTDKEAPVGRGNCRRRARPAGSAIRHGRSGRQFGKKDRLRRRASWSSSAET